MTSRASVGPDAVRRRSAVRDRPAVHRAQRRPRPVAKIRLSCRCRQHPWEKLRASCGPVRGVPPSGTRTRRPGRRHPRPVAPARPHRPLTPSFPAGLRPRLPSPFPAGLRSRLRRAHPVARPRMPSPIANLRLRLSPASSSSSRATSPIGIARRICSRATSPIGNGVRAERKSPAPQGRRRAAGRGFGLRRERVTRPPGPYGWRHPDGCSCSGSGSPCTRCRNGPRRTAPRARWGEGRWTS